MTNAKPFVHELGKPNDFFVIRFGSPCGDACPCGLSVHNNSLRRFGQVYQEQSKKRTKRKLNKIIINVEAVSPHGAARILHIRRRVLASCCYCYDPKRGVLAFGPKTPKNVRSWKMANFGVFPKKTEKNPKVDVSE